MIGALTVAFPGALCVATAATAPIIAFLIFLFFSLSVALGRADVDRPLCGKAAAVALEDSQRILGGFLRRSVLPGSAPQPWLGVVEPPRARRPDQPCGGAQPIPRKLVD